MCLDFPFGESEKCKKPQTVGRFSRFCGFFLGFLSRKGGYELVADAPYKDFASWFVIHIFHRIGRLAEDHGFNAESINNIDAGANLTPRFLCQPLLILAYSRKRMPYSISSSTLRAARIHSSACGTPQ